MKKEEAEKINWLALGLAVVPSTVFWGLIVFILAFLVDNSPLRDCEDTCGYWTVKIGIVVCAALFIFILNNVYSWVNDWISRRKC